MNCSWAGPILFTFARVTCAGNKRSSRIDPRRRGGPQGYLAELVGSVHWRARQEGRNQLDWPRMVGRFLYSIHNIMCHVKRESCTTRAECRISNAKRNSMGEEHPSRCSQVEIRGTESRVLSPVFCTKSGVLGAGLRSAETETWLGDDVRGKFFPLRPGALKPVSLRPGRDFSVLP
jgi:hypothetical protein